jgi:hypothetical protein
VEVVEPVVEIAVVPAVVPDRAVEKPERRPTQRDWDREHQEAWNALVSASKLGAAHQAALGPSAGGWSGEGGCGADGDWHI